MINPFPHNSSAIDPTLFVGRTDILAKVEQFLGTDPQNGRRCETWVVSGDRGQGKSSLVRTLLERIEQRDPKDAVAAEFAWEAGGPGTEEKPLARTLYGRLMWAPGKRGAVPLFWGGLCYYAGNLLPLAGVGEEITGKPIGRLALRLSPGPQTGKQLMELLSRRLRPEIRSVALFIDEISQEEGNISLREWSRAFAKSLMEFRPHERGHAFNVVVVLCVYPRDKYKISGTTGPREIHEELDLGDFSLLEIERLVAAGLAQVNSSRLTSGHGEVTGEISLLAETVFQATGGVPPLTTGLLHDGFQVFLDRGGRAGAESVFRAAHVSAALTGDKCPTTKRRAQGHINRLVLPEDPTLNGLVKSLLLRLADGQFSFGPWRAGELETKMKLSVGRVPGHAEAIASTLALLKSGNLVRGCVDTASFEEPRSLYLLRSLKFLNR